MAIPPAHPRRNADVTGRDRSRLIIDPGPRIVNGTTSGAPFRPRWRRRYATTFPPPLSPASIDTLGEMMRTISAASRSRRIRPLGQRENGPGDPGSSDYANNDGWYDDISDGPYGALVMYSKRSSASAMSTSNIRLG